MQSSTARRVLAGLRDLVEASDIAIGDRLPPERELARSLSCSRETLRRALLVLEDEGELWRHVGQGTFRGARPAAVPLAETLRVRATSVEEFIQARLLIEPIVAGEAARRATAADVAKLHVCVSDGRAGRDRFVCQRADDIFHRTIAEVAKNPILVSVLAFVSDTRRRSAWQTQWDRTYRHIGIEEFRTEHSDQHQHIVAAIERKKPEAAETAMREHLETIIAALQVAPGSPRFSKTI